MKWKGKTRSTRASSGAPAGSSGADKICLSDMHRELLSLWEQVKHMQDLGMPGSKSLFPEKSLSRSLALEAPSPSSQESSPPTEELLAVRESDSDSDSGERSIARASKKLRKPTLPTSGSLGAASLLGSPDVLSMFNAPAATSVDPRLKLRIQRNLFVPFEVLVAAEQGKPINHYLKNPFLTPVNDPKLRVFYPRLNFETWSEGFNIFMYIWSETHPEDSRPMMHYMQILRTMSKTFPQSVWLGYDREFRILRQHHPALPWNVLHPQIYFQQLAKASPFGFRGSEMGGGTRDRANFEGVNKPFVSEVGAKHETRVFRRGYCTHFNLHGFCRRISKCASLAHRCSICEGNHGAVQCR